MLHFFGILTPSRESDGDQRPFFGPNTRLGRAQRDVALLNGKLPPGADERDERTPTTPRFVSLLAPPFL